MPAMSPTMTEGGIANWKVKEGDSFTTGEVLLEIETDKATIDVEAQEDGIMGKIIAGDGTKAVPVGKVIALLAEEGDDITNLEPPKEAEASPASTSASSESLSKTSSPPPKEERESPITEATNQPIKLDASAPIFPSVLRLLHENRISPEHVKGTGRRGMLTKGDVLAYMGKARSPTGTWKETKESLIPKQTVQKDKVKDLDASTVRRMIVEGLSDISHKATAGPSVQPDATFESIMAEYLPSPPMKPNVDPSLLSKPRATGRGYLDGLI